MSVEHVSLYLIGTIGNKLVIAHMTKADMECLDWSIFGPGQLFLKQYFNCVVPEIWLLWFTQYCGTVHIKVIEIKAPLTLVLVERVASGGWNELFAFIYHVNAQLSGHLRVGEVYCSDLFSSGRFARCCAGKRLPNEPLFKCDMVRKDPLVEEENKRQRLSECLKSVKRNKTRYYASVLSDLEQHEKFVTDRVTAKFSMHPLAAI
uniref:Uncharacterized protein n=1 Tax=Glossina pallidipes TaxID=7398 RepID=A0A1A9ZJS8_GLOPL